MDRYFTIMIVPERAKGVKSYRIPRLFFRILTMLFVTGLIMLGILTYDYYQILDKVYENQHLTKQNRQLKEQIALFQLKLGGLESDIKRIHTFEKKLRIITGIEGINWDDQYQSTSAEAQKKNQIEIDRDEEDYSNAPLNSKSPLFIEPLDLEFEKMENSKDFIELKSLYDQKIAAEFGMQTSYAFTKEWSDLSKRFFKYSYDFASFDFKYNKLKKIAKDLEINIHGLDQVLLDQVSFIRSTPTIMPTKGWITSYFGPRHSPYSGRLKMHEGMDIGARTGTHIIAPADGIVTYSGQKPGFGKFVQIDHGYGIETIFGHAYRLLAKKGQRLKRGDPIAKVGSTGLSTGPHLHYEVRVNGVAVDPLYYMLD